MTSRDVHVLAGGLRTWNDRYFVVDASAVAYFETEQSYLQGDAARGLYAIDSDTFSFRDTTTDHKIVKRYGGDVRAVLMYGVCSNDGSAHVTQHPEERG